MIDQIKQYVKLEDKNLKDYIFIIFGPTAVGKSEKAISLAKTIGGEIINADSVQVYKEPKILANIPLEEQRQNIIHKLYSTISLTDDYSVAKWLSDVKQAIKETKANNKIPIITGGTGLYVSSLIEGINDIPSSNLFKQEGIKLYETIGNKNFVKLVENFDPEFIKIHQDKNRLIRAYEVYKASGKTLSSFYNSPKIKIGNFKFINIYVNAEKNILYEKINQRFVHMVNSGAIEETEKILMLNDDSKILKKVIGLEEIAFYLKGKYSLEEAINQSTKRTRNYAKRQQTWFNNKINDKIVIK